MKADRVRCRLIVPCADQKEFAELIEAALTARGLQLDMILDVHPMPEETQSPDTEIARQSTATEPMILGAVQEVPKRPVRRIAHTTWAKVMRADSLWALVDGVAWPGLPAFLATTDAEHECLYTSTHPDTLAAAPWFVRVTDAAPFIDAWHARAVDSHCGILFTSDASQSELRAHFRRFTMTHIPTKPEAPVYFRFYDPRVMIDLANACTARTLEKFFAPLEAVFCPISPFCVLGSDAEITVIASNQEANVGPFRISQAEFETFESIQNEKAQRSLARYLHEDYGDYTTVACMRAAEAARAAALQFGMSSRQQVTVMATCLLLHGPTFWERDSTVEQILNRDDLRPWQKQQELWEWHCITQAVPRD